MSERARARAGGGGLREGTRALARARWWTVRQLHLLPHPPTDYDDYDTSYARGGNSGNVSASMAAAGLGGAVASAGGAPAAPASEGGAAFVRTAHAAEADFM